MNIPYNPELVSSVQSLFPGHYRMVRACVSTSSFCCSRRSPVRLCRYAQARSRLQRHHVRWHFLNPKSSSTLRIAEQNCSGSVSCWLRICDANRHYFSPQQDCCRWTALNLPFAALFPPDRTNLARHDCQVFSAVPDRLAGSYYTWETTSAISNIVETISCVATSCSAGNDPALRQITFTPQESTCPRTIHRTTRISVRRYGGYSRVAASVKLRQNDHSPKIT